MENNTGDYNKVIESARQQLIYNDKGETTVIDFEIAQKMPIVWEA